MLAVQKLAQVTALRHYRLYSNEDDVFIFLYRHPFSVSILMYPVDPVLAYGAILRTRRILLSW